MTVNIFWATTSGGSSKVAIDAGGVAAGDNTSESNIFIRHDGSNSIQNCRFFISPVESYAGNATAQDDYEELLVWGDAETENDFGGLQINMNKQDSFPTSSWPVYDNKNPTGGAVIRPTKGDDYNSGITLSSRSGITANGTIGATEEAQIKVRFKVPINESVAGIRQVALKMRYFFTS